MKHEYVLRGKRIAIEELEDLVAVKPKERSMSPEVVSREFGEIARPQKMLPEDSEWVAFARAGWFFVRPNAGLTEAIRAGTVPGGAASIQRIFLHSAGHLLLGSDLLCVRLRETVTPPQAEKILGEYGLEVIHRLKFAPNLFQVRVKPGAKDFLQISVALSDSPYFEYAEPQFIEHLPPRFIAGDPNFGVQWHLRNTGQVGNWGYAGTPGADIGAEVAWNTTRGLGVRVAIIDNGFDVTHPDLEKAFVDQSGYFEDDLAGGANFIQGILTFPPPSHSHGTFCAGLAAARADNGEGGCGVAHEADLIAIACLRDQLGTQATLARAIAYAADPSQEVTGADPAGGADVISCSFGPHNRTGAWLMSSALQDAIDFAVNSGRSGRGTAVFWSTNNLPVLVTLDEVCSYTNTIAVGRSTRLDLMDFSAFGPELDFLATGVDVHSTIMGGGYTESTGTSFAAPVAAGVGALVLAACPELTWQELRKILHETCDKIGGVTYDADGHHDDYGFGRVSASRAVQMALALCLERVEERPPLTSGVRSS